MIRCKICRQHLHPIPVCGLCGERCLAVGHVEYPIAGQTGRRVTHTFRCRRCCPNWWESFWMWLDRVVGKLLQRGD